MERVEVQGMVDLAIANYDRRIVKQLTSIEDRIIRIDGNGTGKKGAIQYLADQIGEVSADVKRILNQAAQNEGARKITAVQAVAADKRRDWMRNVVLALTVAFIGVAAIVIGGWINYHMGWRS